MATASRKTAKSAVRIELVGDQIVLQVLRKARVRTIGFGTFLERVKPGEISISVEAKAAILRCPYRSGLQSMEIFTHNDLAWGSSAHLVSLDLSKVSLHKGAPAWFEKCCKVEETNPSGVCLAELLPPKEPQGKPEPPPQPTKKLPDIKTKTVVRLLREARTNHAKFERETGKKREWSRFYARYMKNKLEAKGYPALDVENLARELRSEARSFNENKTSRRLPSIPWPDSCTLGIFYIFAWLK